MMVKPTDRRLLERHRILAKLTKAVGGVRTLARLLDIQHSAVLAWGNTGIPADRIIELERLTGIPRNELRPDLYVGWQPEKNRRK